MLGSLLSKYRAWFDRDPRSRKIFVLGSGRSGTHWIGWLLDSHPRIAATIEDQRIFNLVKAIALDSSRKPELLPRLLRQYRWRHTVVAPRHYADKSHPNIWIAEDLAAAFPNALFVGIRRSVYGTVASMLRHEQVMDWSRRWREFPVPNPFLGIDANWASEYESLIPAAQCALRWVSHSRRMEELRRAMGGRLFFLEYEDMIRETAANVARLQQFLGLDQAFPPLEVRSESLDKWRSALSTQDLVGIDDVLSRCGLPCTSGA